MIKIEPEGIIQILSSLIESLLCDPVLFSGLKEEEKNELMLLKQKIDSGDENFESLQEKHTQMEKILSFLQEGEKKSSTITCSIMSIFAKRIEDSFDTDIGCIFDSGKQEIHKDIFIPPLPTVQEIKNKRNLERLDLIGTTIAIRIRTSYDKIITMMKRHSVLLETHLKKQEEIMKRSRERIQKTQLSGVEFSQIIQDINILKGSALPISTSTTRFDENYRNRWILEVELSNYLQDPSLIFGSQSSLMDEINKINELRAQFAKSLINTGISTDWFNKKVSYPW